jgi:hypothetical protein
MRVCHRNLLGVTRKGEGNEHGAAERSGAHQVLPTGHQAVWNGSSLRSIRQLEPAEERWVAKCDIMPSLHNDVR